MYLTRLLLNPRNRLVRKDLGNVYELHRTVRNLFSDDPGRILYRVEENRQRQALLWIQSEESPQISELRDTGDYLVELPSQEYTKNFDPDIANGLKLVFRLKANPVVTRNGKRLGLLREEEQNEWIARKISNAGASLLSHRIGDSGFVKGYRKNKASINLYSVMYDGVLEVTDSAKFLNSLRDGIGPAKGFGFGLMSIARL